MLDIRGAVIELAFDDELPPIDDAAHRAGAIALQPTTDLRRSNCAHPASAPVTGQAAS